MNRRARIAAVVAAAGIAFFAVAASVPYDRDALADRGLVSTRIVTRDGSPLRVTLGAEATRATWTSLAELSPRLVQATLAAEDRRFQVHGGIDPLALGRAAWTNVRARRIVGGGSTITQQLAGLVWPEPRTWRGKWREAVRAVRLEVDFSKAVILEQYLNRAPYGPGVHGVAAASRRWLGCEASALAASQAATLAALPQAPSRLLRDAGALRARRDRILIAMAARKDLTAFEAEAARARELELTTPAAAPLTAPHFADWVLQSRPVHLRRAVAIETTLDAGIQAEMEAIVAAQRATLVKYGVQDMAVVVQAIPSGEVLALVGSPSYENPRDGQVNGALALRQPGSTLKPFVYAMGFAAGMSPADVLEDLAFHAQDGERGDVAPRNYDGRFHGPVRARVALASSFNVPAVRVQAELGTDAVLDGLRRAGFESLDADAAHYGLGLTLGVGEVTLLDLVNAYVGLARGGVWQPPVCVRSARDAHGRELAIPVVASRRWVDGAAAFLVADILADDAARTPGFGAHSVLDLPFAIAVKTGTSTDYRNAWCVGFTRDHAIGIWVGNFDATPLRGVPAAFGAGPLFRAATQALHAHGSRPWTAEPPPGWTRAAVCALSGGAPGEACGATVREWMPAGSRRETCTFHCIRDGVVAIAWPAVYRAWAGEVAVDRIAAEPPRIAAPQSGNVYFRDPRLGADAGIRIAARAPHSEDRWWLDGQPVASGLWTPTPGTHVLRLERHGQADEVHFAVR